MKSNIKFDFDDILLVPAEETSISSRTKISLDYPLPIFAAPMDMVLSEKNADTFMSFGIRTCLPRGVNHSSNGYMHFHSLSLQQFEAIFVYRNTMLPPSLFKNSFNKEPMYVLIDIANGHMTNLIEAIKKAKEYWGQQLIIMCGNIANPYTYKLLSNAGADFIRLGIGNGGSCFIDDTKVNLIGGIQKNIQELKIGDQVLTHKGRYKKIIAKFRKYIKNEDLISINGFICTKEHKFLVVNKIDKNIINDDNYLNYSFWLEAENIDEKLHFVLEQE